MATSSRLPIKVLLSLAVLGALAIPPLAVSFSGSAGADSLWTTLRIAALEAFTLVTLNIITGAFRPLLGRLFKARRLHRFHQTTGLVGFALAVAHGFLAVAFGVTGYSTSRVWIGPVAIVVLVIAILSAIYRSRLKRSWRWIHRLNYLVFAVVLVHGIGLGADLRSQPLLVVCFGVYAAAALAGAVYRLSRGLYPAGRPGGG